MASQLDYIIDECHPHDVCTEEEVDEHSMREIMVSHFSLKRGIKFFGIRPKNSPQKKCNKFIIWVSMGRRMLRKSLSKKHVMPLNLYYQLQKKGWAHQKYKMRHG